eukprot:CAMPEP_0198234076 /NCGR_PEP_ID=MMETSP1446-20131203/170_1 /TAXON_ID=1461542 ORGANISM="Unidentified sp, Strain CCMP2111" /NCGR_SAMPLE_ID=MMETSP1446 /ASSEMBLY_ACC=CAM_ASM_001112 /LENGTH=558 /DNA_ID=CAMNT_0043914805 /DNA_START=423 /DNA_END=2099 /DNA_ORIENTATION=-
MSSSARARIAALLALAAVALMTSSSLAEKCQRSSQASNFVMSEHGRESSLVAEECHASMDYHPFPVEPYQVRSGWLRELSGIARSGLENDIFWGHNDGKVKTMFAIRLGNEESNDWYKFRHDHGEVIARAHLPTEIERQTDWEDIDSALCPDQSGRSCLWIADAGDNSKRRNRPRIHVVVEPELELEHETAGKGEFYDVHLCDDDVWTFQFEFEYGEDGVWNEGGSFDIEAIVTAPEGDKFWLFEKKQHWEDNVWGWPRVFESENVMEALENEERGSKFIEIKVKELLKFPRACEVAPEAWDWLSQPENSFWATEIIESESIASKIYKYKKLWEYGDRDGLKELFLNGTDCTKFPPIFSMITGASLHPKGTRLAIQTYAGAFEYKFSSPLNFSELETLTPRQLGLPRFDQMESIVYSHDGKSLYAIPEASTKKGWQKVQQIKCVAAGSLPGSFPSSLVPDTIPDDIFTSLNQTQEAEDLEESAVVRAVEEEEAEVEQQAVSPKKQVELPPFEGPRSIHPQGGSASYGSPGSPSRTSFSSFMNDFAYSNADPWRGPIAG